MRIVVIGAGIIGVSTAYELASDGHDVTVLDRQPGPCMETSFANGGQISTSHTDPWASPGNLWRLAIWLFQDDSPVRLNPGFDSKAWRWCLQFLRNCTNTRLHANTERMLRIALYSRSRLEVLRQRHAFDYQLKQRGILHVYRNIKALMAARRQAEHVKKPGCVRQEISVESCIDIEPALTGIRQDIAGAFYCPDDESGDAYIFGKNLAAVCAEMGVVFHYNTPVSGLVVRNSRIHGVASQGAVFDADVVIVAGGAFSAPLLALSGVDLPVYPAKGYSMTLCSRQTDKLPNVSLIDDEKKLVYSRLGDCLRVAGMAEFSGYTRSINQRRASRLYEETQKLLPDAEFLPEQNIWAGLRPATPDSVPILGPCPVNGLFLNTGHGTLGWTMAAGSARVLADMISGKTPEIEPDGLTIDRF